MGVPAFYRWLSERYPKIVKDVVELEAEVVDGKEVPVDTTKPNPNGEEFDNLYLDMNGIIHPCFHPENRPAPTLESEVFECIFEYIDRVFAIIRPRQLLYMAIDGVAPRAKMNQQRSRRFRAAQEAKEKMVEEERLRKEFADRGVDLPPLHKSEVMDSNTITPGTPFMARLSAALQYYIHKRQNEDPAWKKIKVILSDSNVPGEGEHKVVDFVRRQRGKEGWNANTKHVLYGLDADLIMLALATHEPYFYILREVVVPQRNKPTNQDASLQMQLFKMKAGEEQKSQREVTLAMSRIDKKPFQIVHICVLREYLVLDLGNMKDKPVFKVDKERLIDDFVLLCFFCGNDFLPHMPTLEIREGAINLLIHVYQQSIPTIGHLCKGSEVNLGRIERFLKQVSQHEQAIFTKRGNITNSQRRNRRRAREEEARRFREAKRVTSLPVAGAGPGHGRAGPRPSPMAAPVPQPARPSGSQSNQAAAGLLRDRLGGGKTAKGKEESQFPAKQPGSSGTESVPGPEMAKADDQAALKGPVKMLEEEEGFKKKMAEFSKNANDKGDEVLFAEDKIRLNEEGWRSRYYEEKFKVPPGQEQQEVIAQVVRNYIEGICWIMKYYYQGCQSWSWYYAYHYAPFASDLAGIKQMKIELKMDKPFKPLNQLMAVLPPASAPALPKAYQKLMLSPESPILDFYPETFDVDPNGKRFAWLHIPLLPFIDEGRLLAAIAPLEDTLNQEERRRNSELSNLMHTHMSSPMAWGLQQLEARAEETGVRSVKMDPPECNFISGFAVLPDGKLCPDEIRSNHDCMPDVQKNKCMCFVYEMPEPEPHVPRIMEGTIVPKTVLDASDVPPAPELWHERGRPRNRNFGGFDRSSGFQYLRNQGADPWGAGQHGGAMNNAAYLRGRQWGGPGQGSNAYGQPHYQPNYPHYPAQHGAPMQGGYSVAGAYPNHPSLQAYPRPGGPVGQWGHAPPHQGGSSGPPGGYYASNPYQALQGPPPPRGAGHWPGGMHEDRGHDPKRKRWN